MKPPQNPHPLNGNANGKQGGLRKLSLDHCSKSSVVESSSQHSSGVDSTSRTMDLDEQTSTGSLSQSSNESELNKQAVSGLASHSSNDSDGTSQEMELHKKNLPDSKPQYSNEICTTSNTKPESTVLLPSLLHV